MTDLGTISVSVDNTGTATITGTGEPPGDYVVDWGDGAPGPAAPLDGQDHTYAVAGVYPVRVSGPDNYTAALMISVVTNAASGPFVTAAVATTGITPITDPEYDVCLWPVDPACLTADWLALSPADQVRSLAYATATLRRLTAYRVGGCPITVRPCKRSCAESYGSFYYGDGMPTFVPHIGLEGRWINGCGCRTSCSCTSLCQVDLPLPIGEIISVDVAGTDVTDDTRVIGNKLTWTGSGDCPFPACQDLAAAPGAPNTFSVTYRNSYPVDGLGANAVAILAMEFAKACMGKACKLPRGTKRITRQGVSIEIVAGSFPDDLTSIEAVDAYILLWRPKGSPRRAPRVWAPGMSR